MVPNTYLLTAPSEIDGFGTSMTTADLIRGLKLANSRIVVPPPREWANGKMIQTGIWLGEPKTPGAKFVCGFDCGAIPEWTQMLDGKVIARGWRAILERCIVVGVASRTKLERIFKVNLTLGGNDQWCKRCRRMRQWTRAYGKAGLCSTHEEAMVAASQHAQP